MTDSCAHTRRPDGPNLEPCELHELIGCATCHPRPSPPADQDGPVFTARYDGWCPGCREPIEAGERVFMRGDRARHEDCP